MPQVIAFHVNAELCNSGQVKTPQPSGERSCCGLRWEATRCQRGPSTAREGLNTRSTSLALRPKGRGTIRAPRTPLPPRLAQGTELSDRVILQHWDKARHPRGFTYPPPRSQAEPFLPEAELKTCG